MSVQIGQRCATFGSAHITLSPSACTAAKRCCVRLAPCSESATGAPTSNRSPAAAAQPRPCPGMRLPPPSGEGRSTAVRTRGSSSLFFWRGPNFGIFPLSLDKPQPYNRNHTPESKALPMQSPAVSRSRHLTVCDGVSVCASAIVQDIRCFGYRNLTLETSSPSSQSSAVASPGPAKCCARSTSPLCHAVI